MCFSSKLLFNLNDQLIFILSNCQMKKEKKGTYCNISPFS